MRRLLTVLLCSLLVLGGCGVGQDEPSGQAIPGVRPLVRLQPTADRPSLPQLEDYPLLVGEGTASLADLEGQVVVVNFWASWCGPCRSEQPALNAAAEELEGLPVTFLGVNYQGDTEANALAHIREFGVPYDSLYDPSDEIAAELGVPFIPSTVLLDAGGRVAGILPGEILGTEEVVAFAERLAQEAPGAVVRE